jgi:hypothetical protein
MITITVSLAPQRRHLQANWIMPSASSSTW